MFFMFLLPFPARVKRTDDDAVAAVLRTCVRACACVCVCVCVCVRVRSGAVTALVVWCVTFVSCAVLYSVCVWWTVARKSR